MLVVYILGVWLIGSFALALPVGRSLALKTQTVRTTTPITGRHRTTAA